MAGQFICRFMNVATVASVDEPRERDQRFAEIRRALDENDREERIAEEDDLEGMAQEWEKVVKKDAPSEDS